VVVVVIFVPLLLFALRLAPHQSLVPFRVIFIKTHKTASSTLATIIRRIGEKRGLRFLNPLDYRHLDAVDIARTAFETYDVICNHARFDAKWMRRAVPDAVLVTIVREPIARFLSAWEYFDFEHLLGMHLEAFVRDDTAVRSASLRLFSHRKLFNSLAYDLGMSHEDELPAVLEALRQQFALVLLAERFDEGLLLLARALNVSLEEFSYLPMKVRNRALHVEQLSAPALARLKELNAADIEIYNMSVRLFEEKISSAKPKLELMEFQRAQQVLQRLCASKDQQQRVDCKRMRMDSFELTRASSFQQANNRPHTFA